MCHGYEVGCLVLSLKSLDCECLPKFAFQSGTSRDRQCLQLVAIHVGKEVADILYYHFPKYSVLSLKVRNIFVCGNNILNVTTDHVHGWELSVTKFNSKFPWTVTKLSTDKTWTFPWTRDPPVQI